MREACKGSDPWASGPTAFGTNPETRGASGIGITNCREAFVRSARAGYLPLSWLGAATRRRAAMKERGTSWRGDDAIRRCALIVRASLTTCRPTPATSGTRSMKPVSIATLTVSTITPRRGGSQVRLGIDAEACVTVPAARRWIAGSVEVEHGRREHGAGAQASGIPVSAGHPLASVDRWLRQAPRRQRRGGPCAAWLYSFEGCCIGMVTIATGCKATVATDRPALEAVQYPSVWPRSGAGPVADQGGRGYRAI
jgi:hypothetical protein